MLSVKNIFIFLFSLGAAAFFVYGSFVFGSSLGHMPDQKLEPRIEVSLATISSSKQQGATIKTELYNTGTTIPTGSAFKLDFGRLATAFILGDHPPAVSLSGAQDIVVGKLTGLFSLYDPFRMYRVVNKNHSYGIDQITNGSFYVSDEDDGTISLYSIDIVAKVTFYDAGLPMTDMILFPGMYMRFDPVENRNLKGVDLYKIMILLQNEKQGKSTGIEFINPRVGAGSEDTFFVYRFKETQKQMLFRMLHALFQDRITQVDMIKNYKASIESSSKEERFTALNPSKRNQLLLQDLRLALSDAVTSSDVDATAFRAKIQAIYNESTQLVKDNSVQATLEQFLTDARFATFRSGNNNAQFERMYAEVANILGIVPDSATTKFFQGLSDIYSQNIAQRRDGSSVGVDTYTATAFTLKNILDNRNIASKDFFDIALYAYQLLQKAEGEKKLLTPDALRQPATYALMDTIFLASEKYVSGLDTTDKKANKTLVSEFYAPIVQILTEGIYATFAVAQQERLLLRDTYLDKDRFTGLSTEIRGMLEESAAIAKDTYDRVSPLYAANEDTGRIQSYYESLQRLYAFLAFTTSSTEYKKYKEAPYQVYESTSGVSIPAMDTQHGALLLYTKPVEASLAQEVTTISPVVDTTGSTNIASGSVEPTENTAIEVPQPIPTSSL